MVLGVDEWRPEPVDADGIVREGVAAAKPGGGGKGGVRWGNTRLFALIREEPFRGLSGQRVEKAVRVAHVGAAEEAASLVEEGD